ERGEELAHADGARHQSAKARLSGDGGRKRVVVELDAKERRSDQDLRDGRELDVGDAMLPEPRSIRASDVSHPDAARGSHELEVNAAHLRIVDVKIVGRVTPDGGERSRERERSSLARTL